MKRRIRFSILIILLLSLFIAYLNTFVEVKEIVHSTVQTVIEFTEDDLVIFDYMMQEMSLQDLQLHKVGLQYSPDQSHYIYYQYGGTFFLFSTDDPNHGKVIFDFFPFMEEKYGYNHNLVQPTDYHLHTFWDDSSESIYLHLDWNNVWRYELSSQEWKIVPIPRVLKTELPRSEFFKPLKSDLFLIKVTNWSEGVTLLDATDIKFVLEYVSYNPSNGAVKSLLKIQDAGIGDRMGNRLLVSLPQKDWEWAVYDIDRDMVMGLNWPIEYLAVTGWPTFYPNRSDIISYVSKNTLYLYNYEKGRVLEIHFPDNFGFNSSWQWNVDGTGIYTGYYMIYPKFENIEEWIAYKRWFSKH